MFKPHIQDVTATAIIKGLAVTKYNHASSRWEVVFLRNCGHHPKLTIREVDRKNGKILSTIKTHKIESDDSLSITVSSPAGNIPWKYVTDGPFQRNPSHDAQDFRWMLDIQALHNGKEVARTGDLETNFLSITDGCFYTSVRTKKKYKKKWVTSKGTPEIQKLGLIGCMFGSDFKGDTVSVEVEGNSDFPVTLRHNGNSRYEIIFDNTCVDENQPLQHETDFQFYYRLFDGSNGRAEILPDDEATDTSLVESEISSLEDSTFSLESDGDPIVGGGDPPDLEPEPKEPPCQSINDGDITE